MFNIVEKKWIFIIISALVIVAGIVGYFVNGFNADIDFTGGSEITIKISKYDENAIRNAIDKIEGVRVSSIQKSGDDSAIIRTSELNLDQQIAVVDALNAAFPISANTQVETPAPADHTSTENADENAVAENADENAVAENADENAVAENADENAVAENVDENAVAPVAEQTANDKITVGEGVAVQSVDKVGASMSKDLLSSAITAVIIAVLLMLIYITFRFELFTGISAVVALCHVVLVMLSLYTLFRFPVNTTFIAAILTILGYSINATIVIFDKIRENTRFAKKETFAEIVNKSIWQTLGRSINTTITTLIVLVCLYILGVPSIKEFALPLIIGVVCGCYSSVFLSGNFWVLLKGKSANVKKQ